MTARSWHLPRTRFGLLRRGLVLWRTRENARKWADAVTWLRTRSTRGWTLEGKR